MIVGHVEVALRRFAGSYKLGKNEGLEVVHVGEADGGWMASLA